MRNREKLIFNNLMEWYEKLPENAKKFERGCENLCNATEKLEL